VESSKIRHMEHWKHDRKYAGHRPTSRRWNPVRFRHVEHWKNDRKYEGHRPTSRKGVGSKILGMGI